MGMEQRSSHPGVLPQASTGAAPGRAPAGHVRSEAHLRAGSVAGLRSLRTGLGLCLEQGGCGSGTIADAQLVLAEIVTNAFLHDTAPLVDVQIVCHDDEVIISTWHRGDVMPPSHPVQPASVVGPVVTPGGRGLAIVDRLVVSREVDNAAGCTTTVARLRR
jgi:anti-sigma regulatory factor (Ser/Thr protein kinase)